MIFTLTTSSPNDKMILDTIIYLPASHEVYYIIIIMKKIASTYDTLTSLPLLPVWK